MLRRTAPTWGRSPKEIILSAHITPDRGHREVIEDAIALGAEGLDLAIVYLPVPHDPRALEPLAEVSATPGLWRPEG